MEELRLEGIYKQFPNGAIACRGVDLSVRAGEVLALLGENGAGKTTLMRVAAGYTRADRGRVLLDGAVLSLSSIRDAILHGIGMVHQHFMLIPRLTVTENIVLGFEGGGRLLDRRRLEATVSELAEQMGLAIEPGKRVEDLSVGAQQRVEVLRALYQGAQVLILDEPTAVLTPSETEGLFAVVRRMVGEGKAVVFITHKLQEVREVADRVVVLRNGAVVGERRPDTSPAELANLMIGATLEAPVLRAAQSSDRHGLALQRVCTSGVPGLHEVDLEVRPGEIVGVAGVDGNGQTELEQVVAGARHISSGTVSIGGKVLRSLGPGQARRLGIVRIPSDRHREGVVEGATVWENLVLFDLGSFLRWGMLEVGRARARAVELVQRFDIRCANVDQRVGELSGGNQQKLVIARELSARPKVVVAAQPTRGLDVGAAMAVHGALGELRAKGAAVLLISADLDEISLLADRVAVLYRGRIIGWASPGDRDRVGQLMAGIAA